MSRAWQRTLVDRLLASAGEEGGWGYRPNSPIYAESTALACLALQAHGIDADRWRQGLAALARLQRTDGSVPVSAQVTRPCWATGLAVLAWTPTRPEPPNAYEEHIARAVEWLLGISGRPLASGQDLLGHDVTLLGWPWVEGTHSWVEPTAYAILALRATGKAEHPRVREGIRLLHDRAFKEGGWNYGNTLVMGRTLRPFPATTGIALAALAGESHSSPVDAAIAYLTRELPRIRSPLSLAWGVIGLASWGALPKEAEGWLAECACADTPHKPGPYEDALLLLAGGVDGPLAPDTLR